MAVGHSEVIQPSPHHESGANVFHFPKVTRVFLRHMIPNSSGTRGVDGSVSKEDKYFGTARVLDTADFPLPPGRYTRDQIIHFISQETQLAGGVPPDKRLPYEIHFGGSGKAISTHQHERQ